MPDAEQSSSLTILLWLKRLRGCHLFGYGAALLLVGLASTLQWVLADQYAGAPFLTIYPAVIVATLVGGVGPGLFAACLAGGSQFGLFIPRFHWLAIASYAVDAIICVLLIVLINRAMDMLLANVEREKEAKQKQLVVANELHHRIQNLFTVVQAIIQFSVPKSGMLEASDLRERLIRRLQSMAAANRAITDAMGEGVSLIQLIENEIQSFKVRFDIAANTKVALSPPMARNFSLVLHELLTNALKHGALSVPNGRINIKVNWNAPLLIFIWQECGAPSRTADLNAGFGSVLLGDFAKSFCQSVDASYQRDGFRYVLKVESQEIRECVSTRTSWAA